MECDNMGKDINMKDLVELIAGMSDDERNALGLSLRDKDVKITARKPKKEAVIIGYRVSLKDWGGRNPRKAGDKEPIYERTLANLLNTWVRGKDAHARKINYRRDFLSGKELLNLTTNFKLVPVANIKELVETHDIPLQVEL